MRYYDSPTARGGQADESLGQQILRVISNVGFAFFVLVVLTFTVIAVTYQPPDPLVQRAGELTSILSGVHNATFKPDDTLIVTGDDTPVAAATEGAITWQDATDEQQVAQGNKSRTDCKDVQTVDCLNPGVKAAIEVYNSEHYQKLLFFKYRQPVPVPDDALSCDVAWKYRSQRDGSVRLFRDYRRFKLKLLPDCSYEVVTAGEWHSGKEAKPGHVTFSFPPPPPPVDDSSEDGTDEGILGEGSGQDGEGGGQNGEGGGHSGEGGEPNQGTGEGNPTPVADDQGIETGVDTVQVAEIQPLDIDSAFRGRKYLMYEQGSDWCKDVNHFQWSFLCALGEARYLGRTFVMNLDFCLPSASNHNNGNETKDFRMYFDYGHLRNETPIVDQGTFWNDWNEWNKQHPDDQLQLKEVPDFHTAPQDLKDETATLLRRHFLTTEPDNYWYRVCEGPAESVIERPWGLLWKSKSLLNIVDDICGKMDWNFVALHVVRGEKVKNLEQYPHLDTDTQADNILDKLMNTLQVQEGSTIYIATNEETPGHFDRLKEHYKVYLREDFASLWSDDSDWYKTTKEILETRDEGWKVNNGIKFDPLMELMVDTEVVYRSQRRIETFNDLTEDCKNGVSNC